MTAATSPPERVHLERVLPAPIEAVFAAWTDPDSMAAWFSPTGRAEVEIDARVGGRLRIVMVGHDMRLEHTGEYLELDPPRRLAFTWASPYTGEAPSVVTVTLSRQGPETRLVLVHERLPEETRASHAGGWTTILDNLAARLRSAAGTLPGVRDAAGPEGR